MLLVAAVVVAMSLHETRPKSASDEANDDDDESLLVLAAVFRDSRLAGLLLPVAVLEIALSWIQAVTPLYADAAGTLTASGIGLLFAYAGALGVVLQFPLTRATSHMSGFAIVLCSGFMQAMAFAFLFVSPALVSLVAGGNVAGIIANVVRATGADGRFRVRPEERAGDIPGGLLGGVRSARRRRTRDRNLAVCESAAGLPWASGGVISFVAALGLAVAARRHEKRGSR